MPIMPITTNAGGTCVTPGPTDVCKTPSPGGPIPLPYPNIAQTSQADGSSCSSKVKVCNKSAATTKTSIMMSSGDEPGTAGGGIMSNLFKGSCKFKKGSSKVKVEGQPVVHLTSLIGQNGNNANMPAGTQVSPSQTKVKVMP
jgi:hypothetical protein